MGKKKVEERIGKEQKRGSGRALLIAKNRGERRLEERLTQRSGKRTRSASDKRKYRTSRRQQVANGQRKGEQIMVRERWKS